MTVPLSIEIFDELDSTQDEARRQFESGGVTQPKVIVARAQYNGRGTQGRLWESAKDAGIYLTLLLPAQDPGFRVTPYYTQATALACVQVLRRLYGLDVGIKPVNDLIVSGRKLGGILVESVSRGSSDPRLAVIYAGIGVNLSPVNLPEWAGYGAISLSELLSPQQLQAVSRQTLISTLADAVCEQYALLNVDEDPEKSETELLRNLECHWTTTEVLNELSN